MLTLLHTADLHLGKILYEHSLLDEQQAMLDCLFNELSAVHYDALIISGDIYDRSVPPPEAVALFDRFLSRTHAAFPKLPVCIISGNHDSAQRLSFAAELLKEQNIYICSEPQQCTQAVILKDKDGIAEAALYQIPFLHSASLSAEDNPDIVLKTQEELITEAVKRIGTFHKKLQKSCEKYAHLPALLSCHVFTAGAQSAGSERIFVGTAEYVHASVFAPFAYTAAGHIHKTQKITERAYYSGSPLAYSFDEAGKEKSFLRVEFDFSQNGDSPLPKITAIPVKGVRRLIRLTGSLEELLNEAQYKEYENDYIEFNYTDPLIADNAVYRLRKRFKRLLSVKRCEASFKKTEQNDEQNEKKELKKRLLENRKEPPFKDIFYAFLQDIGFENGKDLKKDWEQEADIFVKTARTESEKNGESADETA